MNKHQENNRARRICAKLRNTLHTLKTNEERIAAIQFNDELDKEQKDTLVQSIQRTSATLRSQKNRLEARVKELAYEDINPSPARNSGATHFAPETERIPGPGEASSRIVQVSRRQCKCTRAWFTLQEAFAC